MFDARSRIALLVTAGFLCLAVSIGFFPALEYIERWARERRETAAAKAYAPYEHYYDLTEAVRLAARSPDPEALRRSNGAALEILYTAEARVLSWEFWNGGNAFHYGHLALGRIALADGNVAEAKLHLLCAGLTPGSPQLGDYGPDMTLADELLRLGEVEVVLTYLDECDCFWRNAAKNRIAEWRSDILSGRLPHFGTHSGLSVPASATPNPGPA